MALKRMPDDVRNALHAAASLLRQEAAVQDVYGHPEYAQQTRAHATILETMTTPDTTTPPSAPSADRLQRWHVEHLMAAAEPHVLTNPAAAAMLGWLAVTLSVIEQRDAAEAHPASRSAEDRSDTEPPASAAGRERETGPGAWLQRCCEKFDHLLSLDHKPARQASEEYDEAFHAAVHALRDLRRFADTLAPTWRESASRLALGRGGEEETKHG